MKAAMVAVSASFKAGGLMHGMGAGIAGGLAGVAGIFGISGAGAALAGGGIIILAGLLIAAIIAAIVHFSRSGGTTMGSSGVAQVGGAPSATVAISLNLPPGTPLEQGKEVALIAQREINKAFRVKHEVEIEEMYRRDALEMVTA